MKLDLSTVIGLTIIMLSMGYGFACAVGWDVNMFLALYVYQPDSLAITFGGSIGALFLAVPLARMVKFIRVALKSAIEDTSGASLSDLIAQLVDYATEARRNGVLALDSRTEEIKDPFIKNGIQLAVDGTAPEQIESILQQDIASMAKRHSDNQGMILKWAELCPALGMIGTLIGLVAMLSNLSDPNAIGPSMAVAIITTLYGAILANLILIPVATKLESRTKQEVFRKEMIIDAILSIQNGDNPRVVKQKLLTYLPIALRENVATPEGEK